MVRGKVQLKQIENKISRQVTFSKRRTGLFKKAHEISVLCDAEVALMVFSTKGKLFEYSSESSMEGILERYDQYTYAEKQLMGSSNSEPQECWSMEYPRLAARIEILQRKIRNYTGEDLDPLSLRELQNLEVQLDLALKRVRTRKNQVMHDSISEMHKKQKALREQNNALTNKVKENEMMLQLEEPNDQLQNYSTLVLMPPPRALPPTLISSLTIGGSSQGTREADYDLGRAAADQNRFTTTQTIMPQWMVRDLNE